MRFTLTRYETSDQGTFGTLEGCGLALRTAELPWRNNARRISCIPTGKYLCTPYSSKKFPNVYQLQNVPNRDLILIHTGNFAGDVSLDYRSDVLGCILVGLSFSKIDGQQSVRQSRKAMDKLRAVAGSNSFWLDIKAVTA